MKTVCIIQARVGSTRLPNKVMSKVDGVPLLRRVVDRVALASSVDEIVIAIPNTEANDGLADYVSRRGWTLYRGSEDDVLGRYVGAAEVLGLRGDDCIVRVTADCYAADPGIISRIAQYIAEGDDFALCSSIDKTWPKGLDVQAFTADLLLQASENADDCYDREHVVPWMMRQPVTDLFYATNLRAPAGLEEFCDVNLSVDTEEDLIRANAIYRALSGKPAFSTADVLGVLQDRPELMETR